MDAMEDMEGMDILTGSNPTIQPPEYHMLGKGVIPGLRYRHLGKSGLKVSNIGLGSLKAFSSEDCEMNEDLVTLAFENGINFFDISEPFTSKRAEVELGRIIKKKGWSRRQFVVCTKVYWDKTEEKALSRKEIIESVKDSLKNLQLDYIDLLIVHKNDPNCPLEEVLRAMSYLINTGQILYWGTAKWSPVEIFETFSMARSHHCIAPLAEYAEYHPFHREKVELYMAELFNKIGTGLITWSPISLGLCSGKQEDQVTLFTKLALKSGKYAKGGMDMLNLHDGRGPHEATLRVKQLETIAEKLGASLTQLVLAWSLRNNTSQCVIVSASSMEQLSMLLNSLQLLSKLTNTIMDEMDKVLSNKPVRPAMVSTLQQRWAATGGMPPQ
eukprot:GFUD01117673.1.p1 GENE.GFUD01117673.1~~GFUD01117673.1.p1  ORF type:complete len:426 (-),score=94.20 GFUD01117673.1:77-1228(-)